LVLIEILKYKKDWSLAEIGIDLLEPIGLDAQIQKRGQRGDQEILQLEVSNGLGGEVVLLDNGKVEGGNVDQVDLLVNSWPGVSADPNLTPHADPILTPYIN